MKLNKIEIANFRQFSDLAIDFHPEFNLIIGENGKGKTSVLHAIAVAMGGWAFSYIKTNGEINLRNFTPKDVRVILRNERFDLAKQVSIDATFTASIIEQRGDDIRDDCLIRVTRETDEAAAIYPLSAMITYPNFNKEYKFKLMDQGAKLFKHLENGNNFNLPLIVEYSCDRLWKNHHDGAIDQKTIFDTSPSPSRFDPYKNWHNSAVSDKDITDWIIRQTLASLQQGETHELAHIQNAARNAILGCESIFFDLKNSRLVVNFAQNQATLFEHLSDGQRIVFGLFLDIARRICLLNPHLEQDALIATSGIVLIDELDLHLHPKWQRSIINNLRQAFPKIQFICTTHSPQLIGQAKPDELIVLGDEVSHPEHSFGMDSNWILKYIMGSDAQDAETAKKLDSLFEFINNDDLNSAKSLLAELREELDDHPDLVEAEALINRNELFDDKD